MTFIDPPEEELQLTSEEDPRKWPTWKRIWISVGPLLGVFSLTSGNSIYVAAVPLVNAEFQVGSTLGMLPITLYTLGLALGPIISSSTSEVYGRRPVYVLSLLGAMAFNAVGGSASNFRTLAVARLLAGITGGPMIPVVAGTLNDLWDTPSEQIGTRLMGLFACSIAWGSEIGPVMGQPIIEVSGNWRWTFWLSIILLGVSCVVWLNPETFGPELLRQKCRRLGKPPPPRGSLKDNLKIALGRPLHMMIVEPVIVPTSFISAISLSIVFFFYVAYPFIFESIYSFTPHQVALSFLSLLIGSALGLVIMIFINKRLHKKAEMLARTRRLTMKPEEHLYHTMLGGILLPLSLFWFAWTVRQSIHWIVPQLAALVFGAAFLLVMLGWPLYKNAIYGTEFGASVLAADSMIRYSFAGVVPLFSDQMIQRVGIHWSVSIAAFISLALVPVPWVLFHLGPRLRKKSKYVLDGDRSSLHM